MLCSAWWMVLFWPYLFGRGACLQKHHAGRKPGKPTCTCVMHCWYVIISVLVSCGIRLAYMHVSTRTFMHGCKHAITRLFLAILPPSYLYIYMPARMLEYMHIYTYRLNVSGDINEFILIICFIYTYIYTEQATYIFNRGQRASKYNKIRIDIG